MWKFNASLFTSGSYFNKKALLPYIYIILCFVGGTTTATTQSTTTTETKYCVAESFENTTSNQCEFCPKKTYKPTTGNENFTDCVSNKTTSGIGSTSASDCSVGTTTSSSPTMKESVWALVGVGCSFAVVVAVIVFVFYKTTRTQWTCYDTGNREFPEDNDEIIRAELQSQCPTVKINKYIKIYLKSIHITTYIKHKLYRDFQIDYIYNKNNIHAYIQGTYKY